MQQLHLDRYALEARVDEVRQSPADNGVLELIVTRPENFERDVLDEARLDAEIGLVGDNWSTRGNRRRPDNSPDPDGQITLMNSRAAALIAGDRARWPLAGDQLFVDLDISSGNLPAGTRLAIGDAVLEVTDKPHTGCAKFSDRFGSDAWRFVSSPVGRELNVRGINARVVTGGTIRTGDTIRKF
jgi:MOSC domain-containing protein